MANTFKRMEKKTTLPTERVEELKARIAPYMNDDPFNVDGKPYMICNLYYDDLDDHVIRGSVQLPKYKEKLRLRSYGTPDLDTKVFFCILRIWACIEFLLHGLDFEIDYC